MAALKVGLLLAGFVMGSVVTHFAMSFKVTEVVEPEPQVETAPPPPKVKPRYLFEVMPTDCWVEPQEYQST